MPPPPPPPPPPPSDNSGPPPPPPSDNSGPPSSTKTKRPVSMMNPPTSKKSISVATTQKQSSNKSISPKPIPEEDTSEPSSTPQNGNENPNSNSNSQTQGGAHQPIKEQLSSLFGGGLPSKPSENKNRKTWTGPPPNLTEKPLAAQLSDQSDSSENCSNSKKDRPLHRPSSPLPPPPPTSGGGDEKPRSTSISTQNPETSWLDQFDKKDKAPKAITTLPSDKNATYSGKNATIALRGLVINVNKNPFDDFPELQFKSPPIRNVVLLDKKDLKEYEMLIEEILKSREKTLLERDNALKMQQKREEKLMKSYQDEMNEKASEKIKDFHKKHEQLRKERKAANDPMASSESKRILSEFEQGVAKEIEANESELHNNLVKQRLKWILPWLHTMKALELTQYAQIHSLEYVLLEEIAQEERKTLEELNNHTGKLDLEGFDKDLKGTIKERKKTSKPMTKEEQRAEREEFEKKQEERFHESLKKLQGEQKALKEKLEVAQQQQNDDLVLYYDLLEQSLTGMGQTQK